MRLVPVTITLAAIACGDSPRRDQAADAGPDDGGDAGADASNEILMTDCEPSGDPGAVIVEVGLALGRPHVVLVHEQDGSLRSRADAGGTEVELEVPSCGMVTLASFDEFADKPHLLTWVDVQPGDRLGFAMPARYGLASIDVSFPLLAGAASYELVTTGDFADVTGSPTALDARSLDAEVSVLATATVDGQLHWSGASVAVSPPDSTPVTLPDWSQDTVALAPAISGLPAAVTQVSAGVALVSGDDFLFGPNDVATPAGGVAEIPALVIPDGFAEPQLSVFLEHGNIDNVSIARGPAADLGALTYADFMPVPTSFEIAGPAARPTITWAADSVPDDTDIVILELETGEDWALVAPPSATAVRCPEIPADLAPTQAREDTIALVSLGETADYRDALARLDELNLAGFNPSLERYRISVRGDLDPLIIELP